MIKKTIVLVALALNIVVLNHGLEAGAKKSSSELPTKDSEAVVAKKDAVMLQDQRNSTDVFAIPLDESDIEDEVQLNINEKKPNPYDVTTTPVAPAKSSVHAK